MSNDWFNKIDYCDICGSIILRENDKESCAKCGGPTTEIGWIEKNEG
jgi:hypothetical protein